MIENMSITSICVFLGGILSLSGALADHKLCLGPALNLCKIKDSD